MAVEKRIVVSASTVGELIDGLMQCPQDGKFTVVDWDYSHDGGNEHCKVIITIDAS